MAINNPPINRIDQFKYWAHKVMPLVYDESLSYYEFLCKVVAKLNEEIDITNEQSQAIEEAITEINTWEENTDAKYDAFVEATDALIDAFEDDMEDKIDDYYDAMDEKFNQFLDNYQRTFGVAQGFGSSTTDVISQKGITDIVHDIIAEEFSTSNNYSIGEYVIYNNNLYRFIYSHSAGAWNAGEVVVVNVGNEIEDVKENFELVTPVNLLDESKVTTGYFMRPTGVATAHAEYFYTDKISVKPNEVIYLRRRGSTSDIHTVTMQITYLCAYNANDEAVSASGINGTSTASYTVPEGIYSIIISGYQSYLLSGKGEINKNNDVKYTQYFKPYYRAKEKFMPLSYDKVKSCTIGSSPMKAYASSFGNGDTLNCGMCFARKNKVINFNALITTMGEFTIWNASSSSYYDSKLTIDGTNVTLYSSASSGYVTVYTENHGLNISDYISVEIILKNYSKATIKITTNGGSYLHDNVLFYGKSTVKVTSQGAVFKDVYLTWISQDLKKPIWIFGDSWTQLLYDSNWTKRMLDYGYENFMLCSFPGAKSKDMYPEWLNCLQYGKPEYAVWALGMNDADTNNGVNYEWERYYSMFIEDCIRLGITPVITTIPNTPTLNNSYKNNIIRAASTRTKIIDFAKAIGADSVGSSWFSGMYENSNPNHPTSNGGLCLSKTVLAEFPEIVQ